jgi:hypothetical protein
VLLSQIFEFMGVALGGSGKILAKSCQISAYTENIGKRGLTSCAKPRVNRATGAGDFDSWLSWREHEMILLLPYPRSRLCVTRMRRRLWKKALRPRFGVPTVENCPLASLRAGTGGKSARIESEVGHRTGKPVTKADRRVRNAGSAYNLHSPFWSKKGM